MKKNIKEKIEYISIDKVKPYANNPRNNDEAVEYVKNSIDGFGFRNPILVDGGYNIIAGHTRYKAAKELGHAEVPVIIITDLTEDEVKALRLADNKTGEFTTWDFELLEDELDNIDGIDMQDFGFLSEAVTWFTDRERNDTAREEDNEEYNNFLDKFEPKKTTDDCYTPDVVYEAVADWAANEYGKDKKNFVRPFYPGGDYQSYKYGRNAIVVDNPPFSIFAEIIRFYEENNIKYFLFAPTLTIFSSVFTCALCVDADITYENGATINTSFVTNLEDKYRIKSAPTLYEAVTTANAENRKKFTAKLPIYEYPPYVLLSHKVGQLSKNGVDFKVPKEECMRIRKLDVQAEKGKSIYGAAFLLSERMKAEREKAEREKTEVWELSEREKELVRLLSKKKEEIR